jgi:hypothetical protein
LKYTQDSVLDKKRMMDNVQKHNICIKLNDGSLIFFTLQVGRWVFCMKKDHKLQIFKNIVARKISGSEKDVTGRRIINKLHNETLMIWTLTVLSLVPSKSQQDAHIP